MSRKSFSVPRKFFNRKMCRIPKKFEKHWFRMRVNG